MRMLIRTDGATAAFDEPVPIEVIKRMLGTRMLDFVMLADGVHVMIIDDWGRNKELPVNVPGTALYWEKCGGQNEFNIHGDVFICPDADPN